MLLIRQTWRADRTAAVLLVPYADWTAFATALNAEIVRLNPGHGLHANATTRPRQQPRSHCGESGGLGRAQSKPATYAHRQRAAIVTAPLCGVILDQPHSRAGHIMTVRVWHGWSCRPTDLAPQLDDMHRAGLS